jgi:hypothetical protein
MIPTLNVIALHIYFTIWRAAIANIVLPPILILSNIVLAPILILFWRIGCRGGRQIEGKSLLLPAWLRNDDDDDNNDDALNDDGADASLLRREVA